MANKRSNSTHLSNQKICERKRGEEGEFSKPVFVWSVVKILKYGPKTITHFSARRPPLFTMFKMIGVLLVLVSVLLQSHATDESCAITFKTWDLEKWTQPSEFARPRDEESVVQLVQEAAGRGEKVKVMGGGLSFTGVQFVDANAGTMFSLSHMNTILHVDAETFQVEVQAGITIRDLVQLLGDDYKLALPNLGATASQSIVGAAATGTVIVFIHSCTRTHTFTLNSHSQLTLALARTL